MKSLAELFGVFWNKPVLIWKRFWNCFDFRLPKIFLRTIDGNGKIVPPATKEAERGNVMTTVQTLREPKAERLIDDPVSQNRIDAGEPESFAEWYERWCRECAERREREGPPYEDPPLSMEEIVAICKEVRAERCAKKQNDADYLITGDHDLLVLERI